jgi:excisionase family DNA binding protein
MEKIYTPDMAAEVLHVSKDTVKSWLRSGSLQGIKAGRQWRIRESDLTLFINQGKLDTDKVSNQ